MRYFSKLLKSRLNLFAVFVFILILAGCYRDEKQPPMDFVAKVGDEYLTREQVDDFISLEPGNKSKVREYVRNWVRSRVLLQSAIENNLSDDEEFVKLNKETFEQLLINRYKDFLLKSGSPDSDVEILRRYYEANKHLFKLNSDLYILNVAEFSSQDSAERCAEERNLFISGKVEQTEEIHSKNIWLDKKYYEYEFPSAEFYDAVTSLENEEYSGIIRSEQNTFFVVQLINKFDKGSLADYKYTEDYVRELYNAEQKQLALDKIIDGLYDNFEIEIRKDLTRYEE